MNHETGNMTFTGEWVPHAYSSMPLVRQAHKLALAVYKASLNFPREELYGITSQLRRAVVSVPTNICEGKGHRNDRELHRYLGIARASLSEVVYLLFLAHDLGFLPEDQYRCLFTHADEISRMIVGLQGYIRKNVARRKGSAKAP